MSGRNRKWPEPKNGRMYSQEECAAMAVARERRAKAEQKKQAAGRLCLARSVRGDLISEFQLPSNTSYLRLANTLIIARNWLVDSPPSSKDEAVSLVMQEKWDRERRMKSVERLL